MQELHLYRRVANGVTNYDNLVKPDLIASGNKLIGAESKDNRLIAAYPQLESTPAGNSNHKTME